MIGYYETDGYGIRYTYSCEDDQVVVEDILGYTEDGLRTERQICLL
jgi:hypothetical protein